MSTTNIIRKRPKLRLYISYSKTKTSSTENKVKKEDEKPLPITTSTPPSSSGAELVNQSSTPPKPSSQNNTLTPSPIVSKKEEEIQLPCLPLPENPITNDVFTFKSFEMSSSSSSSSSSPSKPSSPPLIYSDEKYKKYSSLSEDELNAILVKEDSGSIDRAFCLRRLVDIGVKKDNVFCLEDIKKKIESHNNIFQIREGKVKIEEQEGNVLLYHEIERLYYFLNILFEKYKNEGPEEEFQEGYIEEEEEEEEEQMQEESLEKEKEEEMIDFRNSMEENFDECKFSLEDYTDNTILKKKKCKRKPEVIVIDENGEYTLDDFDSDDKEESEV